MKYSSRELKLFNLFALFLFGLGGVFFTVGITQLALQPKNEYIVSKSLMNADPKGKSAVTNAPAVHQKNTNADDLITMEGMNLSAVSNGLIGAVFMVLSFLLNSVPGDATGRQGFQSEASSEKRMNFERDGISNSQQGMSNGQRIERSLNARY